MIKQLAIPALMVGALCLMTTPAWSDKGHKGKGEKCDAAELVKDAKVTIDQAIKTALEAAPGTAVEAELEKKHDKTVWEVEVLGADGTMTEVHIDAATGAVIDKEAKHEKHEKKEKHGKKDKH
ncbi:MAG: PepSY domain-containing protein [Nitrospira sp.]|nr:PepSY domain-containing protein [Nitrospira sp.]